MPFQSTVRFDQGFGVVGEFAYDGPRKVRPGLIVSASAVNNVIGRAFTQPNTGGTFAAGGTDVFAGILVGTKGYVSQGTAAAGTLAPTLTLPNSTEGEFAIQGFPIVTMSNANVHIGDDVHFVQATGALLSVAPGTTPTTGNTKVPNASVYALPQPAANGLCVINLNN